MRLIKLSCLLEDFFGSGIYPSICIEGRSLHLVGDPPLLIVYKRVGFGLSARLYYFWVVALLFRHRAPYLLECGKC